jgi:hypothetical protein
MRSIWDKWKEKWNVKTDRRMAWIFVMFAITGSSIAYIRRPFTELMFNKSRYAELNWYEFILTFVLVYLVYQVFLFVIGTLMGEYKFVKWFIVKMNKRIVGIKS